MALYYLCVKFISRKQGRSAVASAAYRSGEKLFNERDGLTHDFTHKKGIIHSEIILPENAPPELLNRQTLWNAVERAEKRRDARTAREVIIALPREFTFATSIALVRSFVSSSFVDLGMIADIAIHDGHNKSNRDNDADHTKILPHNPHAHILLTTRTVGPNGFNAKKKTEWDSWGKPELLIHWREKWADLQNNMFERKGLEVRVSHKSYRIRGIKREPTKHLGPAVLAMERRGIRTQRGDENRAIEARNKEYDEQQQRQRGRTRERSR